VEKQREGVMVKPHCRLADNQIKLVDAVSRELLENPGLLCHSENATKIFKKAGAKVEDAGDCVRIRVPEAIIDKALTSAPSKIVLGAREPNNRLVLDSEEPRVRFGSGSETNVWLDVAFADGHPTFTRAEGSIERLCKAAHLCDNLENLDFFIRCVNIRDKEVKHENKDVNKFLASLNNITKHVQAGLTDIAALNDVIHMGQIIAGGEEAFRKEPVLSFITCVIKSPLQIVDDTAEKLMEISKLYAPVVISSCPMGGATGPFDEFGMVAQINAEVIAGVTLTQLVAPGSPVLYGAVPVRTRLDNLNDMYGAPEVVNYTMDCAQMARFYKLPCYSTASVADSSTPGIQAIAEKMLTLATVAKAGPQYIHYAFGLLERTNVFCPEQAVIDDAHIGMVKQMLASQADVSICEEKQKEVLSVIREVMETDHKTYMYHLPLPTRESVYVRYPLEEESGGALYAAHKKYNEIEKKAGNGLPDDVRKEILSKIPGILPQTLEHRTAKEQI
jgi:trimethylamine--corrinoid protein Co-methyltransferase